jgi:hypothetical protein
MKLKVLSTCIILCSVLIEVYTMKQVPQEMLDVKVNILKYKIMYNILWYEMLILFICVSLLEMQTPGTSTNQLDVIIRSKIDS